MVTYIIHNIYYIKLTSFNNEISFYSQNRIFFPLLRRAVRDESTLRRGRVIFIVSSIIFARNMILVRVRRPAKSGMRVRRPVEPDCNLSPFWTNLCYEGPSVSLGMECVCTDSKPYSVPWCFLYRGSGPPRNASRHPWIDVCPWYGQRIDARAPSPSFRPESTTDTI